MLAVGSAGAQTPQLLFGKVLKKNSHEVIAAVTVHDLHNNKYDQSDLGGNYRIQVQPGDTVVFSSTGYLSDTVGVDTLILVDRYEVFLKADIKELTAIKIGDLNAFQADSLQRREDYSMFYASRASPAMENHTTNEGGFGLIFHPFSYLDKHATERRRLKKRLDQEERDDYINYKFSRNFVYRLTGLDDDSLDLFMNRYRPSYDFCRKATQADMLLYVNDHFKVFRKGVGSKTKAGAKV